MGEKMKTAYGEFCSLQTEAVQLYKDLLKSDVAFQAFIKVILKYNPRNFHNQSAIVRRLTFAVAVILLEFSGVNKLSIVIWK